MTIETRMAIEADISKAVDGIVGNYKIKMGLTEGTVSVQSMTTFENKLRALAWAVGNLLEEEEKDQAARRAKRMKFRKEYAYGGDKKADEDDYVKAYIAENGKRIEAKWGPLSDSYKHYEVDGKWFERLKDAKEYCANA